ncbi:MAG: MBL fold metallo-hydrolase [Lachnospiraceae bacterium]
MKVETFVVGMVGTNCYLLEQEDRKELVIIDPGEAPDYLIGHIKSIGMVPVAIVLTHGHFDHIMGIEELVKEFQIPIYVNEVEQKLIADTTLNMSRDFGMNYTYTNGIGIPDGAVLNLAGYELQMIETPGHTIGSCCYYLEKEGILFSGDTLFHRSVGRSDFPTGSTAVLKESIRNKLLCLPDQTIVYPGHNRITTIGEERKSNHYI